MSRDCARGGIWLRSFFPCSPAFLFERLYELTWRARSIGAPACRNDRAGNLDRSTRRFTAARARRGLAWEWDIITSRRVGSAKRLPSRRNGISHAVRALV